MRLMATLSPEALTVPPGLLPYLSAGWSGSPDRQFDIEIFRTAGGPVFDPMAASDAAAMQTLNVLLAPERLNRLAEQQRTDPSQLGASELLDRLIGTVLCPALVRCRAGGRPAPGGDHHSAGARTRPAGSGAFAAAGPCARRAASGTSAAICQAARRRSRTAIGPAGWPRLLSDREALDKALSEPRRLPQIPPGMPIGSSEEAGSTTDQPIRFVSARPMSPLHRSGTKFS
jgi:hypothetical protein